MQTDRFTDEELGELLTAVLFVINPDRDPEETRRKVAATVARRNENEDGSST